MAGRMDALAAAEPAGLRAEWLAMAASWRDLARRADWQDRDAAARKPG